MDWVRSVGTFVDVRGTRVFTDRFGILVSDGEVADTGVTPSMLGYERRSSETAIKLYGASFPRLGPTVHPALTEIFYDKYVAELVKQKATHLVVQALHANEASLFELCSDQSATFERLLLARNGFFDILNRRSAAEALNRLLVLSPKPHSNVLLPHTYKSCALSQIRVVPSGFDTRQLRVTGDYAVSVHRDDLPQRDILMFNAEKMRFEKVSFVDMVENLVDFDENGDFLSYDVLGKHPSWNAFISEPKKPFPWAPDLSPPSSPRLSKPELPERNIFNDRLINSIRKTLPKIIEFLQGDFDYDATKEKVKQAEDQIRVVAKFLNEMFEDKTGYLRDMPEATKRYQELLELINQSWPVVEDTLNLLNNLSDPDPTWSPYRKVRTYERNIRIAEGPRFNAYRLEQEEKLAAAKSLQQGEFYAAIYIATHNADKFIEKVVESLNEKSDDKLRLKDMLESTINEVENYELELKSLFVQRTETVSTEEEYDRQMDIEAKIARSGQMLEFFERLLPDIEKRLKLLTQYEAEFGIVNKIYDDTDYERLLKAANEFLLLLYEEKEQYEFFSRTLADVVASKIKRLDEKVEQRRLEAIERKKKRLLEFDDEMVDKLTIEKSICDAAMGITCKRLEMYKLISRGVFRVMEKAVKEDEKRVKVASGALLKRKNQLEKLKQWKESLHKAAQENARIAAELLQSVNQEYLKNLQLILDEKSPEERQNYLKTEHDIFFKQRTKAFDDYYTLKLVLRSLKRSNIYSPSKILKADSICTSYYQNHAKYKHLLYVTTTLLSKKTNIATDFNSHAEFLSAVAFRLGSNATFSAKPALDKIYPYNRAGLLELVRDGIDPMVNVVLFRVRREHVSSPLVLLERPDSLRVFHGSLLATIDTESQAQYTSETVTIGMGVDLDGAFVVPDASVHLIHGPGHNLSFVSPSQLRKPDTLRELPKHGSIIAVLARVDDWPSHSISPTGRYTVRGNSNRPDKTFDTQPFSGQTTLRTVLGADAEINVICDPATYIMRDPKSYAFTRKVEGSDVFSSMFVGVQEFTNAQPYERKLDE